MLYRTFYNACSQTDRVPKSNEVVKSANLLFSTLEPSYVWIHCGVLFEKSCEIRVKDNRVVTDATVKSVGSELPGLMEVCTLTEFLLETVSLDAFIDTPSEHLPKLFYDIISKLSHHVDILSPMEIEKSLSLCAKILSKVQPTETASHLEKRDLESKTEVLSTSVTVPNDNNLTPMHLEKSQSDSKLNKSEVGNNLDRSPSPRRRANSSGAAKKNEKKSKKKASKSSSKLDDVYTIHADGSNISVIVNDDIKSLTRNKSMENLKTQFGENESPFHGDQSTLDSAKNISIGSTGSLSRGPSPGLRAQHSMLEKCLRQYEQFYVKLVKARVLSKERSVSEMFVDLTVPCSRDNFREKTRYLEALLNSKISLQDSGFINQDQNTSQEEITQLDISSLYVESVPQSVFEEVLKIGCSLFVELSTFPTYYLSGDGLLTEEEPQEKVILPEWLKVLVVCSCWLGKQPSLQMTSIATLLDLIALSKAHSDFKPHLQSGEGVTTVVMLPLLKQWHISYLEQYTKVFQVLAHSLWCHLGELSAHKYRIRCVELLHELHHTLEKSCNAVEDVIGSALMCDNMEKKIEAFDRFSMLWHLGREIEINSRLRGSLRTFDKSLLKMLDNLQLPDNLPLKLQSQSWLLHSLVRGDISRVVTPVLLMLLDPSTCRMSVLHVSIQHSNIVLTKSDPLEETSELQDETEAATNIYAISSVDGNVIYHVSNNSEEGKKWRRGKKKKKSINPVKVKRIFAVTTLTTGDNGHRYVTERNQTMKELEVPSSISGNRRISVFVNPLSLNCNENSNDSLTEEDSILAVKKINPPNSDLLKHAKRFKKPAFDKGSTGSLDESLFEAANSSLKTKDKSEFKKFNGDMGSSLDSIANSFDSSSSELTAKQPKNNKKDLMIMPGSEKEVAGTILKGKYHNTSNEFTGYDINDVGSFEATTEIPSWTMGDDDGELEASTTAEEYFSNSNAISIVESVLNDVVDRVMLICDYSETAKIVSV